MKYVWPVCQTIFLSPAANGLDEIYLRDSYKIDHDFINAGGPTFFIRLRLAATVIAFQLLKPSGAKLFEPVFKLS